MFYTREQIEAARRRQHQLARTFGERRMMQDGCMDFKIDARLFHNARISERVKHGVGNCWEEPEYVADMKRRHPEIAVKSASQKIRVRMGRSEIADFKFQSCGRLTRFGRVTFHKTYG